MASPLPVVIVGVIGIFQWVGMQLLLQRNFELFAPHLEEVVALTRDKAAVLSKALELAPYDALIDLYEPEMMPVLGSRLIAWQTG